MKKFLVIGVVAVVAIALALYLFIGQADAPMRSSEPPSEQTITNLYVPWESRVLPDGTWMITQRNGKLRIGEREIVVPDAAEQGEGGLLGLALDPEFESNRHLYLYYTANVDGTRENRVTRFTFDGENLFERKLVLARIPASSNHNGGRIAFGPDGFLYVGTGDAGDEGEAQNKASLAGKILRITKDGAVPEGNPFGNEVYSYGHRNVQGLAWDSRGQLWATEHGNSRYDELNRITPGGNYGWPLIQGDETADGMIAPAAHSGGDETWAPSALLFHDGALYFGGLRGRSLFRANVTGDTVASITPLFEGLYGRIRVVTEAGGEVWIGTSNRDGRGTPAAGDDILTPVTL